MSAATVPCCICEERTEIAGARYDSEQDGAVCPDCKTRLLWAQAHLKAEGILGCATETKT